MSNNKTYDLCIVGAGFSGLVLAAYAARAGLLVCLIDLNRLVGRRILSTGNGRCNFTNKNMGKEYYYSNHNLDFISDDHEELVSFLKELGVIEKDLDGYYYPITNQAKTVRDALENEINRLNISVFLDNRVTDITKEDDLFTVVTNRNVFSAKSVCVASGGLAAATLGSSKIGYKMAQKFNMEVTKTAPSLVGATSKDICLKELSGVRAQGKVTYRDYSCEGEVQFTKEAVSGYPVMCISRFIGFDEEAGTLDKLYVDFAPYLNGYELKKELKTRFERNEKATISQALVGLFNEKVAETIISYSRIYNDTMVSQLDDTDIDALSKNIKRFAIKINGTKGFDAAQVTAGGVDLSYINLDTMESTTCKGLYFIGEVLDVDGICGGYNLQWAYSSAKRAAMDLIKEF
ncbi:MAG: aminoacetone oxidase family FAD-binding enzyme [Pseudobutyrivibrio sp.]|nr:aminoacetone oxidase family FAD-binding enzyme [Pseudobutyrivibrio sp.]